MDRAFEVVACHSNHAGKAHLLLKNPDGAEIALREVPFNADLAETLDAQQHRILAEAARMVRDVADFLDAHLADTGELPTHQTRAGASPQPDEAPNVHGQPLPRR